MALITRSLPGLFGGVSQQIPAMRHPTQCEEQLNGVCTTTDGLFKRPGTEHVKVLAMTGPNGATVAGSAGNVFTHEIARGSTGEYQLLIANGSLMLYELTTGNVETVEFPYGYGYLSAANPSASFRCATVADYTFVVNTERTVAMTTLRSPANPTNVAYVHLRSAVVKTRYSITVDGVRTDHTTGDTANLDGIATGLVTSLANARPGYTFSVLPNSNVIRCAKPSGVIDVVAADNWSGTAMRTIQNGVPLYSDLPPRLETGYAVKITGNAGTGQEPYWVRWTGDRWEETAEPNVLVSLDYTTMPHQLRPKAGGGWVFEPVLNWGQRLVGGEESNPVPSFVGRKLRGVVFFRNRLGFLAGDSIALSRAGNYFNFWATSSTQVLDSDPIDLAAPSEQVDTLDWAVPFNENLLVWASKSQQFVLTSGEIMSPNTARLQPTTTFEADPAVRPVAIGNKTLFASLAGSYARVNLYRVAEDTVSNASEDLTEHAPRYVPASPRAIVASTTSKTVAIVPKGQSKTLKVLQYELDANDRFSQKAWFEFAFDTVDAVSILAARWVSRTLYLVLHRVTAGDPVGGGRYVIEKINFQEDAVDPAAGFGVRLDKRVAPSLLFPTVLTLPYLNNDPVVFLKCVNGQEPTVLTPTVTALNTGTLTTRYTFAEDLTGATVVAGTPYQFRYVFSEVFLRDAEGVPLMASSLKLVRFLVRYVSTGWFKATVRPLLRQAYEYPMSGRTVGMPGQGAQELALSTGEFAIPVQTRAGSVAVSIESSGYLPVKVPYAEWVGDVLLKAKR